MKKIWNWFDGRKTNIGMLLMLFALGGRVFFPELLTADQTEFIKITGALIGGFGLTHKGVKTELFQNYMKTKQKEN